jgi:ABC-type antimicrobial peptide transport system permease subunit
MSPGEPACPLILAVQKTGTTSAQRRRELGVRQALGARPVDLASLIAGDSAIVVAAGIVLGTLAAVAGTRMTRALVFGISPLDPRVYAFAALALMLTAVAASLVPAVRAATADPATALRTD